MLTLILRGLGLGCLENEKKRISKLILKQLIPNQEG